MNISVYIAISTDGFIARDDGDVSWLDSFNQDPESDYGFGTFFASVDCLVMGRKTFEKVLSFNDWPYANKQVAVLSQRGTSIPDTLSDTVECMHGEPEEIVNDLAKRGFKHLYIDGGETIRRFLASHLIDDLILTRAPLLLGSGISLFNRLEKEIPLKHLDSKSFSNGLVQDHYRIQKTKVKIT
ncbi:dihydrofolate reductase [Verrucomicrobiaceae bacterium N1E253]|uniref:Dihydrofolate reductase n=1 Tax=Oceaniferula marina TaxID=2748318 RepID=A0A851GLJ1_9BACT|nr:dihydrofolate reductase family protein [Oceaniferula marina]NWK56035.1 dihydrofolate reductase [Oceaniferula marina]